MSDLKPIAEAGPTPTTAAPAELPNRREFHASTPAEFAAAAKVAQGGDTIIVPDWPLPREAAPAEQPGKAADPRPAQPQAPAEPSRHWPDCALNHGGKECDMGPECGAAPTGHTPAEATLREERDRLASQLVGMTGERDDERKISQEWEEKAEAAEKAVAERDARIATLKQASWSFAEWAERAQCFGCDVEFSEDPEPDDTQPCECCESIRRSYRLVIAAIGRERVQSLRGRAALGAPEGQPPAPPQELLGKEGAGAAPPRKAPQEGPMAHFAALADQDCEHGMEAIGETCSAESASREEGNEEDYPFQYWCGPCIAKAVGFKPSPVRIQRARVLAESAPSSPEEQLPGKEK